MKQFFRLKLCASCALFCAFCDQLYCRSKHDTASRRWRRLKLLEVQTVRQVLEPDSKHDLVLLTSHGVTAAQRLHRKRAQATERAVLSRYRRRQIKRIGALHLPLITQLIFSEPPTLQTIKTNPIDRPQRRDAR